MLLEELGLVGKESVAVLVHEGVGETGWHVGHAEALAGRVLEVLLLLLGPLHLQVGLLLLLLLQIVLFVGC